MSPLWNKLSPAEREAYLAAQDAACMEEHRLYRLEETVQDALRLSNGNKAEAARFLHDALAELALQPEGGER